MLVMALRGLAANKLRSALTMLGVVIGAGAVVVAIAIGAGGRAAAEEIVARMGVNVITVRPGRQRVGAAMLGVGTRLNLSFQDVKAILRTCPLIVSASPQVDDSSRIEYQNRNLTVNVDGCGSDYPFVVSHPVRLGRFFTPQEEQRRDRVAVLGDALWRELFDRVSPLGKRVLIGGKPFRVIGVLHRKGGQGRDNPDMSAYIPVTTAMRRMYGMNRIEAIVCQARSAADLKQAEKQVVDLLKRRHSRPNRGEPEFRVLNQAEVAAVHDEEQSTFSALITWLAAVSLVVGGIGIMNVTLVSVTERTREIGMRKAIGAKRRQIMGQILIEAVILSLLGGLLGVWGGVHASGLIAEANEWQVIVLPGSLALAFASSALTGVLAGLYPAWRAASLDPIRALQYQ